MTRFAAPMALAWLLVCAGTVLSGQQVITVTGEVRYWDEIAGEFRPARQARVYVERDWHADVPTMTDDNGRYVCTFPNPTWLDAAHGVDIEVYAEVPGRTHVWSSSLAPWPYHAISREFDDVQPSSTLVLDLWFGKPANVAKGPPNQNVGTMSWIEAPSNRCIEDVARAFIVHEELRQHHRALSDRGWPGQWLGDIDVIVPSFAPLGLFGYETPYYDHFFDNVNLVMQGNPTGFGPWIIPRGIPHDNTGRVLVAHEGFLFTIRHEYSHGIHDALTVLAPFGLNLPSEHSPWTESNRWVAYTEGFADFLTLATLNLPPDKHLWEYSHTYAQTATIPAINGLSLPQGDHWAMEGQVAGLLWDIFDPPGYEVVRHPATTTADGLFPVPEALQRAQVWWDNLSDPGLDMIRTVAREFNPKKIVTAQSWSGSVETIRQFTDNFVIASAWQGSPQARRDLRVAAYNRGITSDLLPPEAPAHLAGDATVRRNGAQLTLELTVREPDPDDRPWVRLTVQQQLADGTFRLTGHTNEKIAGPWAGQDAKVTLAVPLAAGFQPGDAIWLEVNDDMRPVVYRFTVPAKNDGVFVAAVQEPKIPGPLAEAGPSAKPKPGGSETAPSEGLRKGKAEDFEKPLSQDWRLVGAASVAAEGAEHLLTTSGFSAATWDRPISEAFTLRFRYRHAQGIADVLLAPGGLAAPRRLCHLAIGDGGLGLVVDDGTGQREQAATAQAFQPGVGYDVALQRASGQWRVSVQGAAVLTLKDPRPFAADRLAFGSLTGAGFGFDDLLLTADEEPPAQLANMPPEQALPPDKRPPPEVQLSRPGDREAVERLRLAIDEAKQLIRSFADRRRLELRQQRALYRLAQIRGELKVPSAAGQLFRPVLADRLASKATLTLAQAGDLQVFRTWLTDRASGKAPLQPLPDQAKPMLRDRAALLDATVEQHRQATGHVPALCQKLSDALAAIRPDPKTEPMRKVAERGVAQLQDGLRAIETDQELLPALQTHRKALDTLSR